MEVLSVWILWYKYEYEYNALQCIEVKYSVLYKVYCIVCSLAKKLSVAFASMSCFCWLVSTSAGSPCGWRWSMKMVINVEITMKVMIMMGGNLLVSHQYNCTFMMISMRLYCIVLIYIYPLYTIPFVSQYIYSRQTGRPLFKPRR